MKAPNIFLVLLAVTVGMTSGYALARGSGGHSGGGGRSGGGGHFSRSAPSAHFAAPTGHFFSSSPSARLAAPGSSARFSGAPIARPGGPGIFRRSPAPGVVGPRFRYGPNVIVSGSFFPPWYFTPPPTYYYYPLDDAESSNQPVYIEKDPASGPVDGTYSWYYCSSAQAYYPYVEECPEGWQRVEPQSAPAN
jgi:hypothetical protein